MGTRGVKDGIGGETYICGVYYEAGERGEVRDGQPVFSQRRSRGREPSSDRRGVSSPA